MNETRFTLRMDEELLNKVKELAKTHKRSVAKEIEYLLEEQIKDQKLEDRNEEGH